MDRYDWSRLSPLQVGRYAEYYVKMEFTLYGFEVYTSEVDDRCIDFVARREAGPFYEVQVKSARGYNDVFIPKARFPIASHRLVALVLFQPGHEPAHYLIPMTSWQTPDALLVSRDYEGEKSAPEWGVNLSERNRALLDKYQFAATVDAL